MGIAPHEKPGNREQGLTFNVELTWGKIGSWGPKYLLRLLTNNEADPQKNDKQSSETQYSIFLQTVKSWHVVVIPEICWGVRQKHQPPAHLFK